MKITGDILDVLGSASPDGHLLRLDRQLGSALYKQVEALLQTAGGRWDKQHQAFVFGGPAWDAVLDLTAHDEVLTEREAQQADGWFPTPAEVVEQLLELAGPAPWMRALEPSAGEGAIAIPLAERVKQVDVFEINQGRADTLARNGPNIQALAADFLRHRPGYAGAGRDYDLVVMNPPFARGADVKHITHALRFLRPDGRLVAVMAASVRDRRDKAAVALRRVMDRRGGWFVPLPKDVFLGSGAAVSTVIAVIPSQPGPQRPGEPARVTFDRTAEGVSPFTPALAPGIYVHWDSWSGRDRTFRYVGRCIGCGVPTWRHDDGDDDPRGCFGDYLDVPITEEDIEELPPGMTFPRCAACWNDGKLSGRAFAEARARLAQGPLSARGQQLELFEVA